MARRAIASPPLRIVGGALAVVVPVAVTMGVLHASLDKAYRQVWPQLLCLALCLFVYRVYVRTTERRDASEVSVRFAGREVLAGFVTGAFLVCLVCVMLHATGLLQVNGRGSGSLLKPLADLALAATLEELVFRALAFRLLMSWIGARPAFAISAILFGLAHLPNGGFSILALTALIVAGALLSAAYLVHQRLWLPVGIHLGWNYASSAVFGLTSSGQRSAGYFETQLSGPAYLTGGAFGFEASAVTLVVTAAATILLLKIRSRET